MRYTHDHEFLEDGERRTLDHISIGIVAEDGREYYAVNADMPVNRVYAHPWLRDNVWPHLPTQTGAGNGRGLWVALDRSHPDVKPRTEIAEEVRDFLLAPGTPVELWAWYAAFDHVALAWLFGPMVDLPKGIPMFTRDIRDYAERLGNPRVPDQPGWQHNALADARHNWVRLRALEEIDPMVRRADTAEVWAWHEQEPRTLPGDERTAPAAGQ